MKLASLYNVESSHGQSQKITVSNNSSGCSREDHWFRPKKYIRSMSR